MEDFVVELVGVTKRFDRVTAVDNVTLQIRRGEFFSLLGPSGCGKTTSLRMVAGFEEPDAGEVRLDGQPVQSLPPYRRRVNTVFQNYALFPHLNVFDNVAFGLRRRSTPESEVQKRVHAALDLVRLPDMSTRRTHELSGGQQQRVALARALVNEPQVLLLDEPMSALDPKLRRTMRDELKRLQKNLGITFVLVTHDQEEALSTSDRVAVMNGGKVEQVDAPRTIYERPATRFVADFIGTANFLPGRVSAVQNGRSTLVLADGAQLIVPSDNRAPEGSLVELSVRPERLWLSREPGTNGANCLPATVIETTYMGPVTLFTVEVGPGHRLTTEQLNREATDTFESGDKVFLQWQPASGTMLVH